MKPLGPEDASTIGEYRLVGRLGEGGMGQVYLARSARGRTVALKLVLPALARQSEFRQRFRHEVEAARRIGGQWTAPVLDADLEAETPWVATGYVAGPALFEVVSGGHGPLPERSVVALANGLSRALRDIHGAGLVHRDLKPSNVLITIDGPRVIDFGIARAADAAPNTVTRTGTVVGSPGFMSPEQCRGEHLTPASDVHALGSVLYFAATGRSPFGDPDSAPHSLMLRIVQDEKDLSGLSERLRLIVSTCLAAEPSARPTVDQLLAHTADADVWPDEQQTSGYGGGAEPWLPAALIAGLGRHAVGLLDSEEPERAPGAPGTPPPGTPAVPVAPAAQPTQGAAPATPPPTAAPAQGFGPPTHPGLASPYGAGYATVPPAPPAKRRAAPWLVAAGVAAVAVVGAVLAVNLGGSDGDDGGGDGPAAQQPADGGQGAESGEANGGPAEAAPEDAEPEDAEPDASGGNDSGGTASPPPDGVLSDGSDREIGEAGQTYAFEGGDTAVYTNGLEITVSVPEEFTPGEYAYGYRPGDTAYRVPIRVENTGEHGVEVHVRFESRADDGTSVEAISDDDLERSFMGNLLPGRVMTGDLGFSVPAGAEFFDLDYSSFTYGADSAVWTLDVS